MKQLTENETLRSFFRPPLLGSIVKGQIVGKEKSALFLDLPNFGTGIIFGKEFSQAKELVKDLDIGDELSAKVIEVDNEEGYVELSLAEAKEEIAWKKLKELKEKNESLTIKIVKANKGGLIASVEGIQAFLPVSQLSPKHYPKVEDGDQAKILMELQKFIGAELKVEILSFDPNQRTIILSEKAAGAERKEEILKKYKVGDVVQGKITGIVDFGAFFKFPTQSPSDIEADKPLVKEEAIEGLIHISELDWQLIEDPGEIIKLDEIVKAKIIEISNGRVSLSLKALKKDPWQDIEKKHKKGDLIEGTVVKFNPFGAFIKVTPQIQGLIHISEFGTEKKMEQVLKVGEKYQFLVSLIEPEKHRMILKLADKSLEKPRKDEQKK